MGVRWSKALVLVALSWCVASAVVHAQAGEAAPADAMERPMEDAERESGALMPPEIAFASEESEGEAGASEIPLAEAPSDDPRAFYDRYRRFNTRDGATGGYHLVDPSTGMPGSFRIQLATDFFSSSDYLRTGDDVSSTRHVLSASWTPTQTLEVFGNLTSMASSYEIDPELESGSNIAQTLSATGDLSFGIKLVGQHALFNLGADARVLLLSGEGQGAPDLEATGLLLRLDAAVDLREQNEPIPFIARFNLGYTIDNSAKLAADREASRYANDIEDPRPLRDETRHLANRFERLAFGMNRVDMLGLGVGVELPLFVATDFYLHPWLEWTWGVPINRQAYDCPHLTSADVGSVDDFEDGCLDDEGLAASPMVLSLGLRVVTPLRGLSAFVGADVGLLGTSTFVRELAPTLPYAVLLGISVDYDARPAAVQVIDREVRVETAAAAPITGRVQGEVIDQNLGIAVARASVRFADPQLSALSTGDDGRFVSFDLPPGEVRMQIAHPEYAPGECVATIGATGGPVEVRCAITALPRKGGIKLRITDVWGAPVAGAAVQLAGPVVASVNANAEGLAQSDDLAAGHYSVRVDAPNHYLRVLEVDVAARQTRELDLTLTPRAGASRAELRGTEVRLSGTVRFARGSSAIDASLAPVIADIADLLLRNPQLARVRVEGPADAGGDPQLGLARALAIKQRLVDAGVDAGRINAIAGTTPRVKVIAE